MKKKLISVLLAAGMVLSLAACGSGKSTDSGMTTEGTDTAVSADSGDQDAATAETAVEGKVYKIATDTTFAPFEFENDNGEMVGVDLDLLKEIAARSGFQYELQIVGFNAAMTAVEAGEADGMIAGMTINDERKEKYDFSEPYFDSGVSMAVMSDSTIKGYEDLKDQQVAVKNGTAGQAFAESIADQYGFTTAVFEDSSTMYQDVMAGTSAACFEDYPVLGYEISRGMDFKMPMDKLESPNQYGFAVLKGQNPELIEMFNAGLAELKADGTYDEIIARYIAKK